tara:strand:+ start:2204 stop:3583 length:1380 start_codon:yes stop_codon:yes gene_type:complete
MTEDIFSSFQRELDRANIPGNSFPGVLNNERLTQTTPRSVEDEFQALLTGDFDPIEATIDAQSGVTDQPATTLGAVGDLASGALNITGKIGRGVTSVADFALDKTGISKLIEGLANDAQKIGEAFDLKKFLPESVVEGITQGRQVSDKLVQGIINEIEERPQLKKSIIDAYDTVEGALVATGIAKAGSIGIKGLKSSLPKKKGPKGSVGEVIAAPATAGEKSLALSQGRLETPKKGFLQKIFGSKDGTIAPTPKLIKAEEVITRDLPNLDTGNPAVVFEEVVKLGKTKADVLRPQLKAVPINKARKKSVETAAKSIEDSIIKNEDVFKLLTKKERDAATKLLEDIRSAKNAEDLWNARISYDRLIPDKVKKATELSDSVTQFRERSWLENRGEINNLLDDLASDVGVKNDFLEMSSLYEAQENMIKRAKEFSKGEKGIFTTKNAIRLTLGAGAGSMFFD